MDPQTTYKHTTSALSIIVTSADIPRHLIALMQQQRLAI